MKSNTEEGKNDREKKHNNNDLTHDKTLEKATQSE